MNRDSALDGFDLDIEEEKIDVKGKDKVKAKGVKKRGVKNQ